ncbi:hypothetical protein SEUCBS139899_004728 [Sporothrix eucalyptigena]
MAVLQFNATALGLQIVGLRAVSRRSFLTDIPNVISEVTSAAGAKTLPPNVLSQVESAASVAATALPGVASQVKSAAGAAATAGIGAVTTALPQNCSVGSRQFCVGSAHAVTCHDLPLNLSTILPGGLETSLQDTFGAVRDADETLRKLTAPYVQGCFVVGLVLMLVETILSIVSVYGWFLPFSGLAKTIRVTIITALGLVLCVPLVATTVVLFVVQSKLSQLPTWIHVDQGALPHLSLGFLLCALAAAAAGTICAVACI